MAVGILGMAVYTTVTEGMPAFYATDDWPQAVVEPVDKNGDKRFIKVTGKARNLTASRLALLGAPSAVVEQLSA